MDACAYVQPKILKSSSTGPAISKPQLKRPGLLISAEVRGYLSPSQPIIEDSLVAVGLLRSDGWRKPCKDAL